MKTTVIYHLADFDGIFCSEIARNFLPNAELIGWDYGDPLIPFPTDGDVYVLDLSPECFQRSEEAPRDWPRLIWIDHHKSAIEKFGAAIPGYRIDGVAACRLAWQWFACDENFRPGIGYGKDYELPAKEAFIERTVSEPLAVRLAGEYDIWDKRDPSAETFQFGLRSCELSENMWELLLVPFESETVDGKKDIGTLTTEALLEAGAMLQRYQREQDAGIVKRGFDVEFEGRNFLALNIARCNSLTFESAAQPHHDGLMGFYWNGKEWAVSLYHSPHHKEHDLSQIAVKFGGGGHRGACGFRSKTLPFIG